MRHCILDGATLPDADAVYRAIAAEFGLPAHFGRNPDRCGTPSTNRGSISAS